MWYEFLEKNKSRNSASLDVEQSEGLYDVESWDHIQGRVRVLGQIWDFIQKNFFFIKFQRYFFMLNYFTNNPLKVSTFYSQHISVYFARVIKALMFFCETFVTRFSGKTRKTCERLLLNCATRNGWRNKQSMKGLKCYLNTLHHFNMEKCFCSCNKFVPSSLHLFAWKFIKVNNMDSGKV